MFYSSFLGVIFKHWALQFHLELSSILALWITYCTAYRSVQLPVHNSAHGVPYGDTTTTKLVYLVSPIESRGVNTNERPNQWWI